MTNINVNVYTSKKLRIFLFASKSSILHYQFEKHNFQLIFTSHSKTSLHEVKSWFLTGSDVFPYDVTVGRKISTKVISRNKLPNPK